jgi:protein-tyrosine-phosphatase/DNA-binding HxlR family transcriptional regulator
MSSERKAGCSLAERAAVHAALSDPTRLQITDLIAFSDLATKELERILSVPSNLMAHHLKILQNAGLIIRTRSEGDRRRTYVRLTPSATSFLNPDTPFTTRRVVFVCTANSARSQLAERLWRDASSVPAASAGTVLAAAVSPGALGVARRHGLDLDNARPRLLDDVREDGDLYVTVCDNAHETALTGDLHWSIPDPVAAAEPAAFEDAYTELHRRISLLAPHVAAAA